MTARTTSPGKSKINPDIGKIAGYWRLCDDKLVLVLMLIADSTDLIKSIVNCRERRP